MKTLKGPGIFLAQFIADEAPYNNLESISKWASSLGFKGVQIPTNDPNFFDMAKVAESKTYADEIKGKLNEQGVEITELSTHLQGQLVAVHPAYDKLFDGFAPEKLTYTVLRSCCFSPILSNVTSASSTIRCL
jgi:sugar phosphate isomerase/epimerase